MKFGKDLRANMIPEWEAQYIDYRKLKTTLKRIAHSDKLDRTTTRPTADAADDATDGRPVSPPTSAGRRGDGGGGGAAAAAAGGARRRPRPTPPPGPSRPRRTSSWSSRTSSPR